MAPELDEQKYLESPDECARIRAERSALFFRLWEERYGDPCYARPYDRDELARRQAQAKREQIDHSSHHDLPKRLFYHDPIEDDPAYRGVIEKAERETIEELKDFPRHRGYCHLLWQVKRFNLQAKYGVTWFPTSAMNPGVCFD